MAPALLAIVAVWPTFASAQVANQRVTATIDRNGSLYVEGTDNSDSITISGGAQITVRTGNFFVPIVATSGVRNGAVRAVFVQARAGNDSVNCAGCTLPCTIRGGAGDDTLTGGTNNDTIYGDTGENFISGNAGNDLLISGIFDDFIFGGPGNDVIDGGGGIDELSGDAGDDVIYTNPGINRITMGANNGTLLAPRYDKVRILRGGSITRRDPTNPGWSIPHFPPAR